MVLLKLVKNEWNGEKIDADALTRTHARTRTQSEDISPTTNKIEISNHKNGFHVNLPLQNDGCQWGLLMLLLLMYFVCSLGFHR